MFCSLSHPLAPPLARPSAAQVSLSAIKYFIITPWARECKWCNWQLRVKAQSQSWLCKYLSMTDLLAGWGGESRGAGDSQRSAARWSTPGAIRRSAATRGSFLRGYRWPRSPGRPRRSCEGHKAGWGVEVAIRGAITAAQVLGWTVLKIWHPSAIKCGASDTRCKMT